MLIIVLIFVLEDSLCHKNDFHDLVLEPRVLANI